MSAKEVRVDLGRCEAHGKCYLVAPGLLEPDDEEGQARYVGGDLTGRGEDEAMAAAAIDACPEQALSWSTREQQLDAEE